MSEPKDAGRLAEGNYQITMQLSQQRTLNVSGYFYVDDTKAERDARLDAAQDMIDRQFVRHDIVNKEAQRATLRAHIEEHREFLAQLDMRRKNRTNGMAKLNAQELQKLQVGEDTVRGMMKQIETLDAAILEGKRRLGTAPT